MTLEIMLFATEAIRTISGKARKAWRNQEGRRKVGIECSLSCRGYKTVKCGLESQQPNWTSSWDNDISLCFISILIISTISSLWALWQAGRLLSLSSYRPSSSFCWDAFSGLQCSSWGRCWASPHYTKTIDLTMPSYRECLSIFWSSQFKWGLYGMFLAARRRLGNNSETECSRAKKAQPLDMSLDWMGTKSCRYGWPYSLLYIYNEKTRINNH